MIAARFEHPKILCRPTKFTEQLMHKQTINKAKSVYVEIRPSDTMRKKMESYAEIFGNI